MAKSIDSRLEKLEKAVGGVTETTDDIRLLDHYNNLVDGVAIRTPSRKREGLALLADGSEKPIVYEPGWQNLFSTVINDKDGLMDNFPKQLSCAEGKLRMRSERNISTVRLEKASTAL